jgi:hypothetical protein
VTASRVSAEVPPACEICHTPCRLYAFCNFCRRGPVMHHGRCCLLNPGRRRREAVMPELLLMPIG